MMYRYLFALIMTVGNLCDGLYSQSDIDTIVIDELVIAATRAKITDPVSIQNINLEAIESIYSGQDPAVLLEQLSPSIISYSDAGTDIGNYAQFRMRGISQDRINITLNGVPLNDMADQGTYFSNFSDFGNSIESIQVQRGVGASRAGVASYGRAVHFQSRNPFTTDTHSELQLTTGSFGTLRTAIETGTGLMDNNTGVYGRFTRTITEGFKDHSASDSYSFFVSGGYLGQNDVLKVTAFAGKTENDQSYLPVLLDDIERDPRTNYNHPNDTDDFEQEMIQIQYGRQQNQYWNSNYTLYYGGARGVFPFGLDNTTQLMFELNNKRIGLLGNWNYKKGSWDILGGLHTFRFRRINEDFTAPDISNPTYRDQTNKNVFSVFSKIRFSKQAWTFYSDLQLRYVDLSFASDIGGIDHNRDWFFGNWLGGLSYQISGSGSIYTSIGHTSREPTRGDLFQGSEQEILSDALNHESVTDAELGIRWATSGIQLNANLFYMNFNNEIVKTGALQANSYMDVTQNVPNSRRYGIEIQSYYKLSAATGIRLNLAQLNSKINTFDSGSETLKDVQHIFMPQWNINTSIEHDVSDKFNVLLTSRYTSSSFIELSNNSEFILPSYFIINSQFNYLINDRISCTLFFNNMTNKRYYTDGAVVDTDYDGLADGPGYRVQPPRHYYFKLTWQF